MGSKNTLALETILTEHQMESILKEVRTFLNDNRDSLGDESYDNDFTVKIDGEERELNIIVEFSYSLGEVQIREDKECLNDKYAEIMLDYDLLIWDTTVFQQRIDNILDSINESNRECSSSESYDPKEERMKERYYNEKYGIPA